MKRLFALIMMLCMCCSAAFAEGSQVTASGMVESRNVYQITAPFTGVLKPFDWETGDTVHAQDVLFEMETIRIYAPADGTVGAVFAENGDLCTDVIAQYGMLMSIEKTNNLLVDASTSGAYNDEDNRTIHMGERIFFEESNDRDNEGEGRIISVNGNNYVIEVTDGDFENGDSVKIYRDDKMTTKSCIGSGKISRAADVPVAGTGRVLSCNVKEGQQVSKGDLLLMLAAQDAEPTLASAQMNAGQDGALEVLAASGQQAYKGMLLARVHDMAQLNVVAEVDEMDLNLVEVGDSLTVVLDCYPGETFTGTVVQIAQIGVPRQNASYYDVTIELDIKKQLLPGMNATVLLK